MGPASLRRHYALFFFLAGRSAQTGLAIVHWIGCINVVKWLFILFYYIFIQLLTYKNLTS